MRPLTIANAGLAAVQIVANAALLDRAGAGSGNSVINLYESAAKATLLATRTLADPPGNLDAQGRIVLAVSAVQELVAQTGAAMYAEWVAADGAPLAGGLVTDAVGNAGPAGSAADTGDVGPWVLSGTQGTQLYAGGILQLTAAVIG